MPDFRFAIGAVLACALLIVAVFGLAATVQMAHHRGATADDPWRTLAFPDPTDWGLLADRSRPATVAKAVVPEVPPASVAIIAPTPEATEAVTPSPHEVPRNVVPQNVVRQSLVPQSLVPPEAEAAEDTEQPALDTPATIAATPAPAESPMAARQQEPEPVDVVAAIPETQAPPIRPADSPSADDDEPLESSERVAALPGFPTAGHGFVPPEHPIAQRVPLPPSKPAFKKPQKRKVARSRPRWLSAPPPFANSGYPPFSFDKLGPDSKTTGYDKMWTAE